VRVELAEVRVELAELRVELAEGRALPVPGEQAAQVLRAVPAPQRIREDRAQRAAAQIPGQITQLPVLVIPIVRSPRTEIGNLALERRSAENLGRPLLRAFHEGTLSRRTARAWHMVSALWAGSDKISLPYQLEKEAPLTRGSSGGTSN
jgi:hypothetical protein